MGIALPPVLDRPWRRWAPGKQMNECTLVLIFQVCSFFGKMSSLKHYSAIKKNEILPFVATWMDLEGIMLSEISQRKTNTV